MNDEKIAVIDMVSEGKITSSEGAALFEALCDLEGTGSYERDVEADDPKHLPPWESEEENLHGLLNQGKCAKAIASANQEIISALREDKLGEIPSRLAVLDVTQLSDFKPSPGQDNKNGGFTMGNLKLKHDENGLHTQGWGFGMGWWSHTEMEMPPTWPDPVLMQIFRLSKSFRLKWEADEMTDEGVKIVSAVESLDDSVITSAGRFDGCLKLRLVISGIGEVRPENVGRFDITNNLRRVGTQHIWFAPNVGVVKFLYEHHNNTKTEVELADYHVQGGEPPCFPLSIGNNWRYEWQDEVVAHRELIRVVVRKEDGRFILSCANHAAEVT